MLAACASPDRQQAGSYRAKGVPSPAATELVRGPLFVGASSLAIMARRPRDAGCLCKSGSPASWLLQSKGCSARCGSLRWSVSDFRRSELARDHRPAFPRMLAACASPDRQQAGSYRAKAFRALRIARLVGGPLVVGASLLAIIAPRSPRRGGRRITAPAAPALRSCCLHLTWSPASSPSHHPVPRTKPPETLPGRFVPAAPVALPAAIRAGHPALR